MLVKINDLYSDTMNFFYNQIKNIFLLIFSISILTVIISYILFPDSEQIISLHNFINTRNISNLNMKQVIQQMPVEQQYILAKVSLISAFSALIGNTLLVNSLLIMIQQISYGNTVNNISYIIKSSVPTFFRFLLIIFLITILVQLGLFFFIIPGFLFSTIFSLSPIIFFDKNTNITSAFKKSVILSFSNFQFLCPAILLWLLSKAAILFFITKFILFSMIFSSILLNILNNLISSFLIIYLYRLYMFIK